MAAAISDTSLETGQCGSVGDMATVECCSMEELEAVRDRHLVQTLHLIGVWFNDFSAVVGFTGVKALKLNGCSQLQSFAGMGCLRSLTTLTVIGCNAKDMSGLGECPLLTTAQMTCCPLQCEAPAAVQV
ncbi:hypothetical protein NESM_000361100 [Novymonas esmeraldas]|uniref:Uncharacterized protein n=1 Tax=Novymonas esmeraldas TaxID=1808958 RepID=A0AAW0EL09_9TRYP